MRRIKFLAAGAVLSFYFGFEALRSGACAELKVETIAIPSPNPGKLILAPIGDEAGTPRQHVGGAEPR